MTLKTAPRIGARRTVLIALLAAVLSLLASAQAGATIFVSNVSVSSTAVIIAVQTENPSPEYSIYSRYRVTDSSEWTAGATTNGFGSGTYIVRLSAANMEPSTVYTFEVSFDANFPDGARTASGSFTTPAPPSPVVTTLSVGSDPDRRGRNVDHQQRRRRFHRASPAPGQRRHLGLVEPAQPHRPKRWDSRPHSVGAVGGNSVRSACVLRRRLPEFTDPDRALRDRPRHRLGRRLGGGDGPDDGNGGGGAQRNRRYDGPPATRRRRRAVAMDRYPIRSHPTPASASASPAWREHRLPGRSLPVRQLPSGRDRA